MSKYILKESELRSIIKEAVEEELSRTLNEGFWHGLGSALKNTAKIAALGTVAPGLLAQKGVLKTNDILGGNSTVAGTIGDFFGMNGGNQTGKGSATKDGKKTPAERQKEIRQNTATIRREYGEPETEAGLNKKLNPKRQIIVTDFLGSGEDANFGRHYYEKGQDSNTSVWGKKLADANTDITNYGNPRRNNRYVRDYYRSFKKWLEERDKAYEAFIKSIR